MPDEADYEPSDPLTVAGLLPGLQGVEPAEYAGLLPAADGETDPIPNRLGLLLVTTPDIAGHEITQVLGYVSGATARTRHVGSDLVASGRKVVGGEVGSATRLLEQARQEAFARMTRAAIDMGSNAVVGMRVATSDIWEGVSEVLAYGTAVTIAQVNGTVPGRHDGQQNLIDRS